jgi:predicted nucleic acid-binding protein
VIVVDTSVVAYAVIPGRQTESALALALRDPEWVAPRLWRSELRNVLATAMRVSNLDLASALAVFSAAEDLVADVEIESSTRDCLELAELGAISAYDAEFVLAASLFDSRLVTADRRLVRAFPDRALLLADAARGPRG